MKNKIRIAIDGPAAAGKSTVAKMIAEKLSFVYIDTGAMYRSLTYKAIQNHIDLENEEELANLLYNMTIELKPGSKGQLVFADGQNITDLIREAEVTNSVSTVSKYRTVREEMVRRQKALAQDGGVVMDGRDIGTQVIPDAELKIFLLASVDERAQRRHAENLSKGFPSDLDKLRLEIQQRDKLDSEREISPLRKAEDAVTIDTTSLSIQMVVDKIMTLALERIELA